MTAVFWCFASCQIYVWNIFTDRSADFMQGCVFVYVCASVVMMPLISLTRHLA